MAFSPSFTMQTMQQNMLDSIMRGPIIPNPIQTFAFAQFNSMVSSISHQQMLQNVSSITQLATINHIHMHIPVTPIPDAPIVHDIMSGTAASIPGVGDRLSAGATETTVFKGATYEFTKPAQDSLMTNCFGESIAPTFDAVDVVSSAVSKAASNPPAYNTVPVAPIPSDPIPPPPSAIAKPTDSLPPPPPYDKPPSIDFTNSVSGRVEGPNFGSGNMQGHYTVSPRVNTDSTTITPNYSRMGDVTSFSRETGVNVHGVDVVHNVSDSVTVSGGIQSTSVDTSAVTGGISHTSPEGAVTSIGFVDKTFPDGDSTLDVRVSHVDGPLTLTAEGGEAGVVVKAKIDM